MYTDGFEDALKKEIVNLDRMVVGPDSIILREGAYIKEIPIVLKGTIKVRKTDPSGKEITLYRITHGESCILSITSCLNEKPSNAEAVAEEETEIIVVPASRVREWMDNYKEWRKFVMKLYYQRLEAVLYLVDAIAFKQVDTRLIDKLNRLQTSHGSVIKITHQELANDIGTAREVVSRLLKNLELENKIIIERGEIRILMPL